jgi:hypothetical protein
LEFVLGIAVEVAAESHEKIFWTAGCNDRRYAKFSGAPSRRHSSVAYLEPLFCANREFIYLLAFLCWSRIFIKADIRAANADSLFVDYYSLACMGNQIYHWKLLMVRMEKFDA